MKRSVLMIVLFVFCAGCTTIWVKAPEKEYTHSRLKMRAMLPKEWMRYTPDKGIFLTKDGTTLNMIAASKMRFKDKLEYTKRPLTEDMSVLDLAEVEIDNFKSNPKTSHWELLQNKPAAVFETPAYSLEYTYETMSGLKVHGQQYGFLFDNHIYRIRFEAAEQFYYQKTVDDFSRFLKSIQLTSDKE